ncbi:MAG: HigA family addiction module antidote protein [Akkermansiaceae bacterium]|nr:HigA family addiction module antidote protein [Akkermansiaceae bacterium]
MKTITRINPAIELLKSELEHRAISQTQLAAACSVSKGMISNILHDRKRISVDMALKLEAFLGIKANIWLEAQLNYEIHQARQGLKSA